MKEAFIGLILLMTSILILEMVIVRAISSSFELKLGSMCSREDFRDGKQYFIGPGLTYVP